MKRLSDGNLESNLEEDKQVLLLALLPYGYQSRYIRENVRPQIIKNYDGGDIILNKEEKNSPLPTFP